MPTDEQNLRFWLEDKNLEMRDALDVGEGPLIAKGAHQMRASCRQEMSDEEIRSRSAPGEENFAPYCELDPGRFRPGLVGRVAARRVAARREAQNFVLFFFPLPPPVSFVFFFSLGDLLVSFFSLSGGLLVELFWSTGTLKCARFRRSGGGRSGERAVIWTTHSTHHTHQLPHTHTNTAHTHQHSTHTHTNTPTPTHQHHWA